MSDDPEKLLSDALRAQATRAPASDAPVGFELLSGNDLPVRRTTGSGANAANTVDTADREDGATQRVQVGPRQVPAWLILLLALLLGLAAGAVVGLLTLI